MELFQIGLLVIAVLGVIGILWATVIGIRPKRPTPTILPYDGGFHGLYAGFNALDEEVRWTRTNNPSAAWSKLRKATMPSPGDKTWTYDLMRERGFYVKQVTR